MNLLFPKGFAEILKIAAIKAKSLIWDKFGFFANLHTYSDGMQQGIFVNLTNCLPKCFKFATSPERHDLQIPFQYLAIGLLSMTILLFSLESSFAQSFSYKWNYSGSPMGTRVYVTNDTPVADYPYLVGQLNETHPRRQTRAYLMWLVDKISNEGWATTDDVHINAELDLQNSTEGTSKEICSGDTVTVKEISRDHGTWYFETRTLLKRPDSHTQIPVNSFRFWFCPNESAFDDLGVGKNYRVFVNARGRHENNGWNNGQHSGDLNATIIKIPNMRPDLRWNSNNGFLRHIVADGSQSYNDMYGQTFNDPKPDIVDSINAVEEKWLVDGSSAGGTVAEIGTPREDIGHSDWGGMDRPLGDNLKYGTWYFSNNYQRFMFRPDAEAINRL